MTPDTSSGDKRSGDAAAVDVSAQGYRRFVGMRRLANGNSVVTFGAPPGQRGATGPVALHEVSATGQLLWRLAVGLPGGGIFQGDPLNSIGGEVVVP